MSVLTSSIHVDTITHEPQCYKISATPQEREEVIRRLNLLSLEKFEAEICLERKDHIHLTGKIRADVIQECVRTLQPIPQHIEFRIDELFTPLLLNGDVEIDLSSESIVEPLEGEQLDLGEILTQLLSLNLDLFPVAPSSTPVEYMEEEASSSPFKVLKDL